VPKIAIQQFCTKNVALGAQGQGWVNMVFKAIKTLPCCSTFMLLPLPTAHLMVEALLS